MSLRFQEETDLYNFYIVTMGTSGAEPRFLLNALKPMLGINGDIKTPQEVLRIVNLMKDAEKLMSRCIYLNILQSTCTHSKQNIVNKESLERFLLAGGWGILNRWLTEYINSANFPMLHELIEVLKFLPVTIDVLKQGNTGKIVKQMTKLDDTDVRNGAAHLIKQWKGMIRGGNNDKAAKSISLDNGKRRTSDENQVVASKRQRDRLGSLEEKLQPPPEKKIKQLDDKQAKNKLLDTKPIAVESFGFMNAIVSISSKPKKKKKSVSGKTMLPLDEILSDKGASVEKNSEAPDSSPLREDPNKEKTAESSAQDKNADKDVNDEKIEESSNESSQLSSKSNKKKKSLTWAEEDLLTKVFYFELDEEERAMMHHSVSFTAAKHNELIREREALENARKGPTEDKMVEKATWKRPCLFELPSLPVDPGEKSREKYIQKEREQKVLADIFLTKASLPDSPAEPDNDVEDHGHTEPKLIPHDEEGTFYPKPSIPQTQVNATSSNAGSTSASSSRAGASSLLGDAPNALAIQTKDKDVSPAVHSIMKHLMVGQPTQQQPGSPQDLLLPGPDFTSHASRPILTDMGIGFPGGLPHRLALRGSPNAGPRPLLGMQFAGRPRGNFRGRPMGPHGAPMHPRFQRPPRGHAQGNMNEEMYSGMHEELGGHARGNLRSYRGHQSRGRGRGGLHPRGRGTRDPSVCRHYMTPSGCRNGQNCQFGHPWVNGPPR